MNASLIDHRLLRNPGQHLEALIDEGVITTSPAHLEADGNAIRVTDNDDFLVLDAPDLDGPSVVAGALYTWWAVIEIEDPDDYTYFGLDVFGPEGWPDTYGPVYATIPVGAPTLLVNRVRVPDGIETDSGTLGLDLKVHKTGGGGEFLVHSIGLAFGRVTPRGFRPRRLRHRPVRDFAEAVA